MMIYDRRLDLRRLEAAEGALTWALELEAHRRRRVVVMAGMPLFAHAGRREKLTPAPLSAPLKRIKFCGSKTQISLI